MKYTLGLDIGTSSVGWAVLDTERNKIADLGVRLFTSAENQKDGSSLAQPRREARGARRRTQRMAKRMADIKALIVSRGLMTQECLTALFTNGQEITPWQLRAEGLDRLLSPDEWVRVLIHIAKHRGFKSNRIDRNDDTTSKEDGAVLAATEANKKLFASGSYRTVGEMMQCDEKFADHKRNKGSSYSNTLLRENLIDEAHVLFAAQREFGSEYANAEFEDKYIEIFARQRPFASRGDIRKKTGHCTLEPEYLRAPKASWTGERFALLSKIANLTVETPEGKTHLYPEEMLKVANLAYKNAKVTYTQIRKEIGVPDNCYFIGVYAKKGKDPEENTFIELKAYHKFRKTICDKLGKNYWEKLVSTSPQTLDKLACALTFEKDETFIREELKENGISDELADAIISLNFSGCMNLSLEAMSKLIPFMENGDRYDEACEKAGYSHYAPREAKTRTAKLPVPEWEEIRNPVVVRSISQVRKVVNAIIGRYGAPSSIHIELARDIAKPKKEREQIEKEQNENKTKWEKLAKDFEDKFHHTPSGYELEKYYFWKEQGGFSPYTCNGNNAYMNPEIIFNGVHSSYCEIDHIIPYSRSFDNSFGNKVLVLASENREKGNKTPYEFFGGDTKKWEQFCANVDAHIKDKKKAARLKSTSRDTDGMKERSLNDTRYITRYIANYLKENVLFADDETEHIVRLNGRATAYIRKRWGINSLKDRENDNRHHALDACVIAAVTRSMIARISEYSRKDELSLLCLEEKKNGRKEHFPEPWQNFRKEVAARISDDPANMLRESGITTYTEEELEKVKPIFISSMPNRKASYALHEETIRSAKYLSEGRTAVKTPLTKVNKKALENMVGKERDTALYKALKKRLSEFDNDPQKAFAQGFKKPSANNNGSVVRSIKIYDTGTSGVSVCGGFANNDSMVRIDVYKGRDGYYLVPNYAYDVANGIVKDKAIAHSKPYNEWPKMGVGFKFIFSLYKNDLVKIVKKNHDAILGYYSGCDISTASITLTDVNANIEYRGIGVKTLSRFEKYGVGVLGDYHIIKEEKPPQPKQKGVPHKREEEID